MSNFIMEHYQIFRALHLIGVMSWMAGMLYLPRLFAYHAEAAAGSDKSETFKTMERRLLRFIMNPAMIAAWLFGLAMLAGNPALLENGWMHIKLACVIGMTALHHVYARWRKVFERDGNVHPAKFYKFWNEVPTALMIVIIIMAVVEPL